MRPSDFDPDGQAPMSPWWDEKDFVWRVKDWSGVIRAFHDEQAANDWIDEQSIKPKKRGW